MINIFIAVFFLFIYLFILLDNLNSKEEHKINDDDADDERLEERTVILTDETTTTTTENDSVIASYAQLEELERAGRRSLDYVRYSECLERLEKTIFES